MFKKYPFESPKPQTQTASSGIGFSLGFRASGWEVLGLSNLWVVVRGVSRRRILIVSRDFVATVPMGLGFTLPETNMETPKKGPIKTTVLLKGDYMVFPC